MTARRVLLVLGTAAVLPVAFLPGVAAAAPTAVDATYSVDSIAASADEVVGDGTCAAVGGGCTLTAALQEAAATLGLGEVVVNVPAGTHPLVGPITVERDLTVRGAGRDATRIELGGGTGLVVDDARLVLDDVEVGGGSRADDDGGAAVHAEDSDVEVTDSRLEANTADGDGGALRVVGGSVRLVGTDATGNSGQLGGALYAALATVEVTDSTFRNNSAATAGGAIYLSFPLSAEISGSTFTENGAVTQGGAIAIVGFGGTTPAPIEVTGSTFTDNLAGADGGAIYIGRLSNEDVDIPLEIRDSTFQGNSAQVGGALAIDLGQAIVGGSTFRQNRAVEGSGGAIASGGSIEVAGSTFTENSASQSGGALSSNGPTEIDGSTFTRNTAEIFGGALSLFGVPVPSVTNSTFEGNVAGVRAGAIHRLGEELDESGNDYDGNVPDGPAVVVGGPTVAGTTDGTTDGTTGGTTDGTTGGTTGGTTDGGSSSSGSDGSPRGTRTGGSGFLPRTGMALGALALLGAGLVGAGQITRRRGDRAA